jgi:hypothetical protein
MVKSLLYKVIENYLKSRNYDNIIIKYFRKTVIFELTKRFDLQFEITQIISVSHILRFFDPRYKGLEYMNWFMLEKKFVLMLSNVKHLLHYIVVHQQ